MKLGIKIRTIFQVKPNFSCGIKPHCYLCFSSNCKSKSFYMIACLEEPTSISSIPPSYEASLLFLVIYCLIKP